MPNPRLTIPAAAFALAGALLMAHPAAAHHGFANFDLNTEITITGTVAEVVFVNPHSWLYVDVTAADGAGISRVTKWKCELRGAAVLRRSGWTPEMFARGTRLAITGAPDRFEANTCYLGTIVFDNGTRIDRYGQITRTAPSAAARTERPARRPDGRPNFAGDWAGEQRVLTDPRGMSGAFLPISVASKLAPGSVPEGTQAFPGTRGTEVAAAKDPIAAFWNRPSARPLTAAGSRAIEGFDGASTDNPRLRCEPTNILFDWTFESDVNRIRQDDDRITMTYGSIGLERTIHLNLREHPPGLAPSRAGHSIGRWEDDVLVVDTVAFAPGILSADARLPHSERLHVVERFWLDAATGALRRSYVAVDPLYFEGEYAGADAVFVSDIPYQVTPCDDRSFKADGDNGAARWMLWGAGGLAVTAILSWGIARRRRR